MRTYAKAVAVSNVSLSGTTTIDSIGLISGERVLLTAQTTNHENGLWNVSGGDWSRTLDANTDDELYGLSVFITQGTLYGDTAWQCVNDIPLAVGTDEINFVRIPGRHIYDNLASDAENLGDANVTITVTDGKRRRLPVGTLTAHRTITISSTDAIAGDTITIDREDRSHCFLYIETSGGTLLATMAEPGELVLFWDGTTWKSLGLRPAAGSAVFNVRAFGARGNDSADDAAAIQAAFDAAWGATRAGSTGATIYIPRGHYKVSTSLKIPRTGIFHMLTIHGDGMDASRIERTGSGLTFEPQPQSLQPATAVSAVTFVPAMPPDPEAGFIDAPGAQFITNNVRAGDIAVLAGTGSNNGNWEVHSVISETRIKVKEGLPDAGAGGTVRVDSILAGVVTIRDLAFGGPTQRAFDWDFGDATNFQSGGLRPTIFMQRVTVLCGTGGTADSAIHLFGAQGCHFTDVIGYGLSGNGGVLFHLEASSSSLFERCRILGVPGALCRITGGAYNGITLLGGGMTLVSCRGEGGIQTPEFYFEGQTVLTLIDCNGEGETSNPAQFQFVDCTDVTMINPAFSTNDQAYTGTTFADGLLLDGCSNVRVINAQIPAEFNAAGDGTARGIRIKSNCESVHVLGLRLVSVSSTDVEIEAGARDCHAEIYLTSAHKPTAKGTKTYSKLDHLARVLRVNHDTGTGLPSQLCGLWVWRGVSGSVPQHQAFLAWDEGADGWKAGVDNNGDESTVALKKGFIGLNFRPYSGDNFEAWSGQVEGAYDFRDSAGTLQLQIVPSPAVVHVNSLGKQLILTSTAHVELTAPTVNVNATTSNARMLSNGVIRLEGQANDVRLNADSSGKISFQFDYNERLKLIYSGSAAQLITPGSDALEFLSQTWSRMKFDTTGIGFFNATPVAQPNITGSKGGNAALGDLLTKLAAMGLITDSTT